MAEKISQVETKAAEMQTVDTELVEKSSCGRWERRDIIVKNFLSGAQCYLGVDMEEGIEVIWCEVSLSRMKKEDFAILSKFFDRVVKLNHPNVLKVFAYWIKQGSDNHEESNVISEHKNGSMQGNDSKNHSRLIIITESINGENIQYFMRKYFKVDTSISLWLWKKFCRQLLSGLSYLHSHTPPYILGFFSSEFIFMAHGPILKLAAFMPLLKYVISIGQNIMDANWIKIAHLDVADDIFSFGMLALKMACPNKVDTSIMANNQGIFIGKNSNKPGHVRNNSTSLLSISIPKDARERIYEHFLPLLDSLSSEQRELIGICLNPKNDPLLTAHRILKSSSVSLIPPLKILVSGYIISSFSNIGSPSKCSFEHCLDLAVNFMSGREERFNKHHKAVTIYNKETDKKAEYLFSEFPECDITLPLRRMCFDDGWMNSLNDYNENLVNKNLSQTQDDSSRNSYNTQSQEDIQASHEAVIKASRRSSQFKYQATRVAANFAKSSSTEAPNQASAANLLKPGISPSSNFSSEPESVRRIERKDLDLQNVFLNSNNSEQRKIIGCFISILDSHSQQLLPCSRMEVACFSSSGSLHLNSIHSDVSLNNLRLSIELILEDGMKRTLVTYFDENEDCEILVNDLLAHGLICRHDEHLMKLFIANIFQVYRSLSSDIEKSITPNSKKYQCEICCEDNSLCSSEYDGLDCFK